MKRFLLLVTAAAMALSALVFTGCSLLDGAENTAEATPDPLHAGIESARPRETYAPYATYLPDPTGDPYSPSLTVAPIVTQPPAATQPPQQATAVPAGPTQAPYNPNMRNWQNIMPFPSREEIDNCNRTATERSPYIAGHLFTDGASYTQYSARFKADYLPPATYCCLGNFKLDYSALLSEYTRVWQDYDHVSGYAGFQVQRDGRRNSIMSFWNIYCARPDGSTVTITPSLVYPEKGQNPFGGEGTGVNCLPDYSWQAGRWYEMRLIIGTSEETGNSTVEQWVLDVEADEWTYLCKFDLGVRNVTFTGDMAVFLEDYYPDVGGEIRTMECRDCWIIKSNGDYMPLTLVCLAQNFDYPGSYVFGADGNTFYMITTGVKNVVAPLQEATWYELAP